MNNLEETKIEEEEDEILEKLRKEYPDVVKQTCVDCGYLISYHDWNSSAHFDEEGNETTEPDDYALDDCDSPYSPIDPDDQGGRVCVGCQESLGYHGSTLIIKTPAGNEYSIKFNSTFYSDYDSHIEKVEGLGISKEDILVLMQGRRYHRTDAWRGHHYSDPDQERWSTLDVEFAWLSGHHSNELVLKQKELLEQAFKELEIPVFYCVHMSSNVFFQNIDVFVSAKHEENAGSVISFINDFTGAEDFRWNAGIMMHFDEDKALAEKLEKQLKSQELPEDWSWKDFINKLDEMTENVKKFKIEGFSAMSFEQQIGVMAGSGSMGLLIARTMMSIRDLKTKKESNTTESD